VVPEFVLQQTERSKADQDRRKTQPVKLPAYMNAKII
jgi:hypothetical protein